ncbi:MAG TPA: hypothetical protein VKR61_25315 [Bryobacteraceae bacterium]|nr:hypothetical protein [Bryobacteraceae bacterium]
MAKRKKQDELADRRTKRRFSIEQGLRYRLLYGSRVAESGSGRTINISSSGVWFTTEGVLSTGLPVELSMAWPARLNDVCPMKLMIYGCVVRSDQDGAALAIERYEFRTQGNNSVPLYEETGIRLPT